MQDKVHLSPLRPQKAVTSKAAELLNTTPNSQQTAHTTAIFPSRTNPSQESAAICIVLDSSREKDVIEIKEEDDENCVAQSILAKIVPTQVVHADTTLPQTAEIQDCESVVSCPVEEELVVAATCSKVADSTRSKKRKEDEQQSMPFRKFHDYVEKNLISTHRKIEGPAKSTTGVLKIEAPTLTPPGCLDTFEIFSRMGIEWQYDRRAKQRGRQKSELGRYKVASSYRIEDWIGKLRRLEKEENLREVIRDEENIEAKATRNPDIAQAYENLTAKAYSRKLRNRIRALKLRIKKKEEDQELQILRKMARRLNQLHRGGLL